MDNFQIEVLPKFWKDWKDVCKHHKGKEFSSDYLKESFDLAEDGEKVSSIRILDALTKSIIHSIEENIIDGKAPKYDKQPFLSFGWTVRKTRWGTDTSGKSKGLRHIFCLNGNNLLLVFIATKNKCADERKFEKEFMARIRDYLDV